MFNTLKIKRVTFFSSCADSLATKLSVSHSSCYLSYFFHSIQYSVAEEVGFNEIKKNTPAI